MPLRPPVVSSARKLSSWLIVLGGLVLYAIALLGLAMAQVRLEVPWPWWAVQAAPVVVYGVIVLLAARPTAFQLLGGVALLWTVHLVVGTLSWAVLAMLDAGAGAPGWAFPPPPLPELVWVPLLIVPLRDILRGDPRPRQVRSALPRDRRPIPERRIGSAPRPVPPRPRPAPKSAAPSPTRANPATPATPITVMEPRQEVARPEPPADVAPEPAPAPPVAVVTSAVSPGPSAPMPDRAADGAQEALDALLARDVSDEPLRVSFDRVASQLPASMFTAPIEHVAAELEEPGRLLIDRRIALSQLHTGIVRATWQAVAGQFPADLLATTAEEIGRLLPADGQLVLPIDELVSQLPRELFISAAPEPDVRGIEEFPAPFQPLSTFEPLTALEPANPAVPAVRERSALDEPVSPGAWVEPYRAEDGETEPEPLDESPPPRLPTPDGRPPGASLDVARIVSRLLPPLGPLEIEERIVAGVRLVLASTSGLGQDLAVTAARLVVPLLASCDVPWPVEQVTLRGADAAVVLTPVGRVTDGGTVLAATVTPGGSLALVEIRCRHAAADAAARGVSGPAGAADEHDEPDLLHVECSTRVQGIASTLHALGPVTASTLRDAHADRALYLFLPAGSDVRAVGALAQKLSHALEEAAEAGALFRVAVLRGAGCCLVIRPPAGASARFDTIVAAGETARPGLAYRQVERAAVVLGAP